MPGDAFATERVPLRTTTETKSPGLRGFLQSGRRDSNSGPLVPQTSALTRLRHAPRPSHPSGHAESVALERGRPLARRPVGQAVSQSPGSVSVRVCRLRIEGEEVLVLAPGELPPG